MWRVSLCRSLVLVGQAFLDKVEIKLKQPLLKMILPPIISSAHENLNTELPVTSLVTVGSDQSKTQPPMRNHFDNGSHAATHWCSDFSPRLKYHLRTWGKPSRKQVEASHYSSQRESERERGRPDPQLGSHRQRRTGLLQGTVASLWLVSIAL